MVRIFVGSSIEQKDFALEVSTWLEDCQCDVKVWYESFEVGDQQLERLYSVAKEVDAAVLIFGEDDEAWYRGSKTPTPRDNVVFELGLFTGTLGGPSQKRAVFIKVGSSKVPSDLQGITYDAYNSTKKRSAEKELKRWARGVTKIKREMNTTRLFAQHKKQLFEHGTDIISVAKNRVRLFAKTPVPIVGPRPYEVEDSSQYSYERDQFAAYWKIIERAAAGELSFALGASLTCFAEELKGRSLDFKESIKEKIRLLYEMKARPGSKISLHWTEDRNPTTFVVGDLESILWFKGHNSDNVWFRDGSAEVADALATTTWKSMDVDAVLKHL